jgi:hypothetical protein
MGLNNSGAGDIAGSGGVVTWGGVNSEQTAFDISLVLGIAIIIASLSVIATAVRSLVRPSLVARRAGINLCLLGLMIVGAVGILIYGVDTNPLSDAKADSAADLLQWGPLAAAKITVACGLAIVALGFATARRV